MILFPEVDFLTEERSLNHQRFCMTNDLPDLGQVLYPRFPGFVQACTILGENGFKCIYDITVLYSKPLETSGKEVRKFFKSPKLYNFVFGKLSGTPWLVDIHIEKRTLSPIDLNRKNLEKWLEKAWYNKETMIEDYVRQYENQNPKAAFMAYPKAQFKKLKETNKSKNWFKLVKNMKKTKDV